MKKLDVWDLLVGILIIVCLGAKGKGDFLQSKGVVCNVW